MIQELATGWSPELATGSSPELSSGMDPELKLRISVRRYRSAPDSRQSGMYPGSVLALGPDSDFVGPTFLQSVILNPRTQIRNGIFAPPPP